MPNLSQCKGGSAQHVEAWKKKLHQGLLDVPAVELLKAPSQNQPQLEMLDCKWSLEMVEPQNQPQCQGFQAQNPARNSKRNLEIESCMLLQFCKALKKCFVGPRKNFFIFFLGNEY
jgi:hypothetical protein